VLAVQDALRQVGASVPAMPLTPARMWRALRAAGDRAPD